MTLKPFKCLILKNNLFTESRLSFEGIEEKMREDGKKGIRFHSTITAFFLRLLGKKIVNVKDITGKIYHINRGSLSTWMGLNGGKVNSRIISGQEYNFLSESAMVGFLVMVVRQKAENSPTAGKNVKIADLKTKLANLEAKLSRERANRPRLKNLVADLKAELSRDRTSRPGIEFARLKNLVADLEKAEFSHDRANRPEKLSIFERNLKNEIAETKNRLNTLQGQ